MFTRKLLSDFTTAVDTFDFNIKKTPQYNYVLTITANQGDTVLATQTIVLGTSSLPLAVEKAVSAINAVAREIAPGILQSGRLTVEKERIRLHPMKPNEVARGIFADTIDNYVGDCCDYCECDEDDYDDEYEYEDDREEVVEEIKDTLNDLASQLSRTATNLENMLRRL